RRRHTRSKRDWSSDVCSSDLILFSSGTTGKSKGIVLSYRSIVLNSTAVAEYLQLEQNDCFYISKALSHSSTLVGELLVALRYREIGRASCRERVHRSLRRVAV